ncbi:uncharacterized protein N7483_011669 [Penicillium malachiteum]|uniref:uncharacterized protein n=1 Tax=Penicillium malachiteum TaxID=1324776 RepID=UPI002546A0C8|nr:uncharacterized protein N7483_011669 [Penicillium malachiteum]KAJ5714488.1 hypothetical protein N7483_011669 [Penicillium malachiteum]
MVENPEAQEPFLSEKREGTEWHVVLNPDVQRVLDVDLIYHLKHDSVVSCVRFSEDGKYLVTGGNGFAQIFDMITGSNVATFHGCYSRSVCFSHDGEYLATGADDRLIRIWDIASCTIKSIFDSHEQGIFSLDISKNGQYLVSGGADKTVYLWDILSEKPVHKLHSEDLVTTVSISPDGHYLAAGSLSKIIRIWDTSTGELLEQLENPGGHGDSVYSVAFAHNSHDLVSGSLDKTIKLWELAAPRGVDSYSAKGKCVRTFKGHEDIVLSICLTPDNQWIISGLQRVFLGPGNWKCPDDIVWSPELQVALRIAKQNASNPACQISLECGIAWHLLLLAFFCRDPITRDEAVQMLREYACQDGLWSIQALYTLALKSQTVERINAVEGTSTEQWRRLWHREYVSEGGNRVVFRYQDKNEATGKWQIVEEVAEVGRNSDAVDWVRRPLTGFGALMMGDLVPL